MALAVETPLGLVMRFRVVVDEVDLGGWSSCAGLSVDFTSTLVKEGANYAYQPILPDRVVYPRITLTRAMNRQDSLRVQQWLSTVVADWYGADSPTRYTARTARITLLDAHRQEVASWSLRNVYPAAWKGPNLDASGQQVAVETLELVHEGFL
ncbi:phage tail protein [Planosporangium sp. 12N6]|uniref:phage tail protein n=1 Tax=Planosporangium spinosum TaxID=3402278 RepID=UPI003CF5C90C